MVNDNKNSCCCSKREEVVEDVKILEVKKTYDAVAEGKGSFAVGTNKFSPKGPTNAIINYILNSNKTNIIDIGCGMGTTVLEIVKNYPALNKIIGLDFSQKMIEKANEERDKLPPELRKKVGFFVVDIQSLPYMDEQFDIALSECVFNLIPFPNREKALSEVYRVLADDGAFLYTDFVAHKPIPEKVKNCDLVSGCKTGSITALENINLLRKHKFSGIQYVDFTEDKNKRAIELRESSEEIRKDYEEFSKSYPDIVKFIEEELYYYLFIAKKELTAAKCCG
ncbi:MAG: methyltransferase domain-containing protein [Firmicutes bacterium]|nr:methyltransferase domain-containing protein [Bacillota bacterium]